MEEKNYLILAQYRENSEYDDLIGMLYHFPSKYKNMIRPGSEFIYYEPAKQGAGTYFGYGKVGQVVEDKRMPGQYFVHIIEYVPFINEVALKKEDGSLWEDNSTYNPQNAVRYSSEPVLHNLRKAGGLTVQSDSISFKTRARTVDMLGRQQIAGIPTAINELFKNAHDAYADNVIVDYYTSDGLFVLRDDGLGMTLDDFKNRWLTLGTDSKVSDSLILKTPQIDPTKDPRPSMGEKGIGRLAVSIIGPQVLVLTRAKRFDDDKNAMLHDTVAAFINWKMFEIPGVNIDEIIIPLKTFQDGILPNRDDVAEMVNQVKVNLERLKPSTPQNLYTGILSELAAFSFDPQEEAQFLKASDLANIDDETPYSPLILSEISGTHFYISPSDPIILEDLSTGDTAPSKLKKHLLGFTNTMTPNHETPKIKASFREHNRADDQSVDIIGEDEFFDPTDFNNADHRFQGEFDEFGQFHGTVTIYGKEPRAYHLPWKGNAGKETLCGSFSIDFAAIQGNASESSLPADIQKYMYGKTEKVGGLYIYKNGIRVLPYGDNDFDFLDIEKRRAMNLGSAYFSYRRMFGAIEINHIDNHELKEKAGREGFQENKAYRQFRDMLIHFLKRVVEDFIQEKGIYSETFIEERKALKEQDELRKKRESKKKEKLTNFLEKFKKALNSLQELRHIDAMNSLKNELQHLVNKTLVFNDTETIASKIIELENNYFEKLHKIEKEYNVTRPQGIVIKKKGDSELWTVYQAELNHAEENVFEPTKKEIETIISEAIQSARIEIDRRRRIEKSLTSYITETKKVSNKEKNDVLKSKETVEDKIKNVAKDSIKHIEEVIRNVSEEFNTTDFSGMSEDQIAQKRMDYESRIEEVANRERKTLETVQTLLDGVDWDFDVEGNIVSDLDIYESNERALNEAQGQMKIDMQLAQIGTAVNIINHEFDSSIRTVRRNLGRLKAWADVNENLAGIYNDVRASFEHIDGYLTLFAPLNRRLYRKKVSINGRDIYKFIENLFRVRLERHDVKLLATDAFKKHSEEGYPSTFYPTFVNLVDNAIYWLKKLQNQERVITLDAQNDHFIIADNGPGIREEIRDMIFDLGFSAKPGGRGMGLYIAKNSLNELGFDLNLLDVQVGTAFEIIELKEGNE